MKFDIKGVEVSGKACKREREGRGV